MASDQHRGSTPPGPLSRPADPRVGDLDHALRAVEAITPGLVASGYARDASRHSQAANQALGAEWSLGTVVHAIPHVGWYKVQLGNMRGFVGACKLSDTGSVPLGVRDVGVIPPNSQVLVYKPRGLNFGIIAGVLPSPLRDGRIPNPDWVCQGGQSGYKREDAHKYPIGQLYRDGGVIDFSGQRPVDSTGFEWGKIASTGAGVVVSDYEAFLRVNEACGVFANIFDSHLRVAGVQLDVVSAVHEVAARDDEGESRLVAQCATYPWEALGIYQPGTDFTQLNSDQDVQYDKPVGKLDLPDGARDVQPVYRWAEFGGYLGQGHLRWMMKPARDGGKRLYSDTDPPDEGVFCESVGVDGAYSLRSAKSVHVGRRLKIVCPKEVRPPEDKKSGDDAEQGNYKFSSMFGGGADHKLAEVRVTGEWKAMRRLAAVEDLIAFGANWRALHPFHYHKGDYETKQESQQSQHFSQVQENLDFGALDGQPFMRDPTPITMRIDHRYSDAQYFQRESFIHFADDGGVLIADGFGAEIRMGGGSVMIGAPGDLQLCPGRDLLAFAWQVILRAKQSVDVSATEKDVRIKAEKNVQVLAGNAGSGGILLESKGTSKSQSYDGKVGEDVVSNGVVVRAATSAFAVLAGDVYLRTGQSDLNSGDIVLDAGKGTNRVQSYGREVNAYVANEANVYVGPSGEASSVARVYNFGRNTCIMDAKLLLGGKLIGYQGTNGPPGIVVDGGVYGTQSFATAGVMADKKGMFLGKVPGGFGGQIQSITNTVATAVSQFRTGGEQKHAGTIVQKYYQQYELGNDALVRSLKFSFRDKDGDSQYRTQQLKWVERRWEQMARLGSGSGGKPWTEKPVTYQGRQTYPWPGRAKWQQDPIFLELESLTMFDPGAGYSKDRPGPYEQPRLKDWTPTTMESSYKLIR